jgi:hypothetical protein
MALSAGLGRDKSSAKLLPAADNTFETLQFLHTFRRNGPSVNCRGGFLIAGQEIGRIGKK